MKNLFNWKVVGRTYINHGFGDVQFSLASRIQAMHDLSLIVSRLPSFPQAVLEYLKLPHPSDSPWARLDHLHGLDAFANRPPFASQPILRRLQGNDRRPRIYRLPSELAHLRRVRRRRMDGFRLLQVPCQNITI